MWLMATVLDREALHFVLSNWAAYGAIYWKRGHYSRNRSRDTDS